MDLVMGIQGRGFVLLLADAEVGRSVLSYKHDEDKIVQVDDRQLLACAGDSASRTEFTEYIEKNLALFKLRSGRPLSNHASANFIRNEIAEALRSRGAYQANCLFGSLDHTGAALYHLDYLGTLQKMPFAAHGFGGIFATSILDANYSPLITEEEAKTLMKKCCDQVAKRCLVQYTKYYFKIINEKGVAVEEYRPMFKEV